MQLIDGKATAAQIKAEIAEEVKQIVESGGKRPHLAAILVGHDGGSETYVRNKVLACEACGFKSTLLRFEDTISEEELLAEVDKLNKDEDVDGFIVQLPLPRHISEQKVIEAIDFRKDVDGFHPINVGRMAIGLPCYISATPKGILELLRRYHVETSGKKCVILGRSNIVGKPMAQLMMQKQYGDATVTVCHSRSRDLKKECREADIIIAARHGRHGERGSYGHRRGHDTRPRRYEEKRIPPQWRCEIRRGSSQMCLHHPRTRRSRPDDHLHADEKYTVGGQKGILSLTGY